MCKTHHTEPLDIFCADCKQKVPPRALYGDQSVVAMIGDTASGKTCLLWVLRERLAHRNGARYVIRQALGDSDAQLAKAISGIAAGNGYQPTPSDNAATRNYAWELIGTDPDQDDSWIVAFHDAAGELWRNFGELPGPQFDRLRRYFDLASAIILVIDGAFIVAGLDSRSVHPSNVRQATAHELAIVDELQRRLEARQESLPISVVVSKADMFWDREEWSLFRDDKPTTAAEIDEAVRSLLVRSGRETLVETLEEVFEPCHYFAVSAFGRSVPANEFVIGDLKPSRVEEPLFSLLAELDG